MRANATAASPPARRPGTHRNGVSRETAPAPFPTQARRFTVAEYDRMIADGYFGEDERVELLDGRIVEMAPPGDGHCDSVNELLNELLPALRRAGARVICQSPIRLGSRSEPEPDLAVLRPREGRLGRKPNADEIALVVGVSDSSIRKDREEKLPLYAAAGIPEVWIVDLAGRCVEIYRDPESKRARYRTMTSVGREGKLSPAAFPKVAIRARDVLPE